MMLLSCRALQPVVLLLVIILLSCKYDTVQAATRRPHWPSRFLSQTWKKVTGTSSSYTPLLFFTVPPGLIPECDAMEEAVRQLERDMPHIRVERLDILRNPAAEAVLNLLTTTKNTPPFLYHRESCQIIHIPPRGAGAAKEGSANEPMPIYIDKQRLRAWAKGRLMSSSYAKVGSLSGTASRTGPVTAESSSREEEEKRLSELEDLALTPRQREGKQKMQERTAKGSS